MMRIQSPWVDKKENGKQVIMYIYGVCLQGNILKRKNGPRVIHHGTGSVAGATAGPGSVRENTNETKTGSEAGTN